MKVSTEYFETLQRHIDIIANNIANINTTAFKEGLLAIEETYDLRERSNTIAEYGGVMPGGDNVWAADRNMYLGRRVDFSQGSLVETGITWDMAIQGKGFFQIRTPDGKLGYTRVGSFRPDGKGNLVNNEGMLLYPQINIPANATEISINSDGTILGFLLDERETNPSDGEQELIELGQIRLYDFNNPDGLEQIGQNIYLPTAASGEAVAGIPGENGYGEIKAGMLEKSNTDLVRAIANLIEAQRAYQFDLRIIKTQDEMLQQAIMMRG
ncbi:MAG TPA: flagellar hook-basal body complex protein [Peptococcaceae bacterium]|nr:flagellar hook-basal body complex protein [Peptococcaceae bacterium]